MRTFFSLILLLWSATAWAGDADADSGLVEALRSGNLTAARQWLDRGADPGYRGEDPYGAPLLLRATLSGQPELVRLLLERGADPDARDLRGTPLLVSAAAMAQGPRSEPVTQAIAELLANPSKPADPNATDRAQLGDDRSALHVAASLGNLPLLRMLLDRGAHPNLSNRFGETPLFFAADRGHASAVELLIAHGANAHLRSRYTGMTPLGLAAEAGHSEIVRYLLKQRANPASRNAFGKTPVDLAREAVGRNPAAAPALVSLENAWMRQTLQATLDWIGEPSESGVADRPLRAPF